ncbi:MAG: PDZ domain-containing protein [Planctomycetia bacterium]|nr:PDZ domain-containing protein [Planctomycetia bacterium]
MPFQACHRQLACLILTIATLLSAPRIAGAEEPTGSEPSGLQAAVAIERVLVDAIARNESSVVAIGLFRNGRSFRGGDGEFGVRSARPTLDEIPDSFGTGVVIEGQGLILTNAHVLREDVQIFVRAAGLPLWCSVKVKGSDPLSDLAVLEIVDPEPAKLKLRPITWVDGDHLKRGQIVVALGNPYAIARDGQISASWGIVSNLGRRAPPAPGNTSSEQRPTMHHYGTLIQTDAKLNLGTSGGPLINLKGEMVGLTTAMAALAGYEKSAGFAVAVDDTFRRVVRTLAEGREVEYGFLGVEPGDLMHEELADGQRGVRIQRTVAGTPANATLQVRDIVTHIDGEPMTTSSELMLAVGRRAAGQQIRMTVLRDGKVLVVPARLSKNRIRGTKIVTTPRPAWRGLRVEYPSALRSFEQADPIPEGCVIVTEVQPGSAAAAAGLRTGMQISHVEETPVTTPDEFQAATAAHAGTVRLKLTGPDATPAERTVESATEKPAAK